MHTSCDVTVRLGERLQINCTIFGALGNFSKYQLSWYRGAQRLTNITKTLNNETIQLVIDHVDWDNNGMYICKGNGRIGVQPKHVAVTVGGKYLLVAQNLGRLSTFQLSVDVNNYCVCF